MFCTGSGSRQRSPDSPPVVGPAAARVVAGPVVLRRGGRYAAAVDPIRHPPVDGAHRGAAGGSGSPSADQAVEPMEPVIDRQLGDGGEARVGRQSPHLVGT